MNITELLKYFVLVIILLVCNHSVADEGFWQHKFNVQRDIAYGELDAQKLDIYGQGQWTGPPNYFVYDKMPRKTLVYIHGGAWHGGSKESALWSVMPFVEKGWQAISLEYRLGGGTAPNAAVDVLSAMNWIYDNADKYAIDVNHIVVSGDSAGGHLALTAGLTVSNPSVSSLYQGKKIPIKAIVNWFGITDVKLLESHLASVNQWNYPRLWAGSDKTLSLLDIHYSPINLVTENSPPVLTIHGTSDKVVPFTQGVVLHEKLNKIKVHNKLAIIKEGRHLGFNDEQFQSIFQQIFAFLENISE